MKITFLGTNGWFSTSVGDTICTLVETERQYIVFDAGEGLRKLDQYIVRDIPVYLFLSHLHLDHIYGLHTLPKMDFLERLTIILHESHKANLLAVARPPFTIDVAKHVRAIISVGEGAVVGLPFVCECRRLRHQDEAFGYRIEVDGKSVAYCSDTGFCEGSTVLARGADLLIHECANRPGMEDGGWGHSNPAEAARIASEAGAKRLALTHFSPEFYPDHASRKVAQIEAAKVFSETIAVVDGMILEL